MVATGPASGGGDNAFPLRHARSVKATRGQTNPQTLWRHIALERGSRVGRGIRWNETRIRKANRVPVDPGPAMVADGFVELQCHAGNLRARDGAY